MAEPGNIPGGAEIWRVDGTHYFAVYEVPGTNPTSHMYFHIPDMETYEGMWHDFENEAEIHREVTHPDESWDGAINGGSVLDIAGEEDHPFHGFVQEYERLAEVNPALRDEEVMSLIAKSTLTGEPVSEDELARTNWWQNQSEAERQWTRKAAQDPETAQRDLERQRAQVASLLREENYQGDIVPLAEHLGERAIREGWNEQQIRDNVRAEVDPHFGEASPFAGRYMPEGAKAVKKGSKKYIRTSEGDYRLTGPGQVARYAPDAEEASEVNPIGEAKDLFERLDQDDALGLRGTEDVRQLVGEWLGPLHQKGWNQQDMEKWASKIRDSQANRDLLVQELRREKSSLFPEYEEDLPYEEIVRPYRSLFQEEWGERVDEEDEFFLDVVRSNDMTEARRLVREEGLDRGKEQVVRNVQNAATKAFQGTRIRGGLV